MEHESCGKLPTREVTMTVDKRGELLTKAFSIMNAKEKANVRYHLNNKTALACGDNANFYTTQSGAL